MKKFFASLKEQDIRNALAVIVVLSCFVIQVIILLKEIPSPNHDLVLTTVSYTLGGLTIVLAYFFGASKGDKKKDDKPET